jgi:SHS2 domain-containing protein
MNAVGHSLHPHTADLVLEVWGPSREEALAEAVRGLAATYAEPRSEQREEAPFAVRAATDEDLLVGLLDETIYLADARGRVALDATVRRSVDGVTGTLVTGAADDVDQVGPVPKGVSRSDLVAGPDDGGWRARVTIDV